LYDAEEFELSQRSRPELFQEACAIYQVVYQLVMGRDEVSKCGFVWKVAGRALCQFYALKHGEDTALCSFPVLEDAFKRYRP
jgi:RNA-dependent RNA polymerase